MIKAVIFDMDGVLVDTEPLTFTVMRQFLAEQYDADLKLGEFESYIGMAGVETFKRIIAAHGLAADPAKLRARFADYYTDRFMEMGGIEPIAGVKELVEALHGMDVPMGVASSSPRRNIELTLEKIGLINYFRTFISSQDMKRPKPAPDVYLAVAEGLTVPPAVCAAVEDTDIGVEAANSAGMVSIAVRNPTSGKQSLAAADAVIDDIRMLDPYILLGLSK